ncbi:MAG: hypothetical protein LBR17_06715 [Bacteroidales bacterium]|jgi:hypothetical protein|nr:hypothetical protein [Bacteroidales bacterium]
MGHNADWIPTRELEFKAWVNNFITKLSVYKTTLEITNQTFEQLQTAQLNAKWVMYSAQKTMTKGF